MIESHIAQLAASISLANNGKISGQPEELEIVNLINIFHAGWFHRDRPSGVWKDEITP
jgi:hypothetical protein